MIVIHRHNIVQTNITIHNSTNIGTIGKWNYKKVKYCVYILKIMDSHV